MRARGLTLVETLLTLSMAAILGAASIGGLMGVQTWRATSAARRVHADIAHARTAAMLSQCRTLCTFDVGAGRYALAQESVPGSGKIDGPAMKQPLNDLDWQVSLADLGGAVALKKITGVPDDALGFDGAGRPVRGTGKPIKNDVHVQLSTGAEVVIYAGSGLCEIKWP